MNDNELSDKCLKVRLWMLSLLDQAQPFTPDLDKTIQELWQNRESAIGEHKAIIHVFELILDYRKEQNQFTPYYFEQQDRLQFLMVQIQERIRKELIPLGVLSR